jgi:hypothetical protein
LRNSLALAANPAMAALARTVGAAIAHEDGIPNAVARIERAFDRPRI